MILFCRLAVVSSFTSFLYVHDCSDKHGAQQTHFQVVTGFLTYFQTLEGHNNFQVLLTHLSSYSQTFRKRPPNMRRFSSRLPQVVASLRSKRFRAVSEKRTRTRAKDRSKNGVKPTWLHVVTKKHRILLKVKYIQQTWRSKYALISGCLPEDENNGIS